MLTFTLDVEGIRKTRHMKKYEAWWNTYEVKAHFDQIEWLIGTGAFPGSYDDLYEWSNITKRGFEDEGLLCGNRGNMSPGMLGISDWGIMIHLFFLHLPTQKRCWSFFISLGRKAREGLDSIFQGEHARCIPQTPVSP